MATKRGTNLRDIIAGTNGNDVLLGLGGNDDLFGRGGNDKLLGGTGNDRLFGEAGNDLLDGGTGADRMTGGKGNDTYIVDNVGDRGIELAGQGTDTVKSSVTHTLGANAEHLILAGTKAINGTLSSSANEIGNSLTGNSKANTLNGGLGHDVLAGGLGADTLNGGDGNDTLIPGAGAGVADIINGGNGFDTVDYRDATTGVYVDLQQAIVVTGGAATGDVITNVESVVGSAFHDVLVPNDVSSGADRPFAFGGGGGDFMFASTFNYDLIRGDDGDDLLVGDFGSNDDFWLQYDRGLDYVKGYRENGMQDHVFIVGSEFGLSTAPGNFIHFSEFISLAETGVPEFFNPADRLKFDSSTKILWADKDGSGTAFDAVAIAVFGTNSVGPTQFDIFVV